MAAQFDEMGNYLGDYETEEERKRREELANTAVHTQEIKTYGDGTQERVTKEEIPGAIAPKTVMTAAGPVAPDEVYQRQLQAESGGRQNNPATGQIMTSPKGALGIAQIMPSTAMSPGFGVPDIFTLAEQRGIQLPDRSEATARQLLANQELNQEFGQQYKNGMLRRFGGDQNAATAAYNAGPGRVGANVAGNQGQLNVAGLPQETQGYLSKVMGGLGNIVNAVIPSAQAAPAPANVRAQAYPEPGVAVATGRGVQGTMETPTPVAPGQMPAPSFTQPQIQIDDNGNKMITNPDGTTTLLGPDNRPMAAGGMVPQDTAQFRNRLFEEAGKDPFKWMEIAKNPEYAQFPEMATVAKQQARALFEQEFKLDSAKEQATKLATAAAAGDPKAGRAIADELKNQEGSWLKMILLGFLSPQLAGEEAVKLGFGDRWQSVTNDKGESALIKVNARGLPLQGIGSNNQALTQDQLAAFATGGAGKKLDIVGGTYINDRTGEVGRVITDQKTGQSYIQTDTGRKPMSGFRPQSSTGGLSDMRARQIQELNIKLQGKTLEEKMAILRPYNQALVGQGMPAIDPSEVGIQAPQIGGGAAPAPAPAVGGGVATPAVPGAQGAPASQVASPAVPNAQGAAPAGGKRPTMGEIEANKTKLKEEAQEVGTDIGKIRANQPKSEEAADYLLTKVDELITHPGFNFSVGIADAYGVPIPGASKIAGLIPGSDTSDWDARFKEVQGRQFLQAVETLRGTGAISNQEGDSAKAAIARMNTSQSEKEFKAAVNDFKGIVQRGIDNNRVKLGQEPKYGTPAASESATPQSPADKARAELERRRKEKK